VPNWILKYSKPFYHNFVVDQDHCLSFREDQQMPGEESLHSLVLMLICLLTLLKEFSLTIFLSENGNNGAYLLCVVLKFNKITKKSQLLFLQER